MPTSPLVTLSLREQIVDLLRTDVMCGRLPEGQRINEAELASRFGVSRTPIREAIQQLTYEGLLEGRHNAGARVSQRPPDSIRELVVPIRRRVEIFALRSYFDTINDEDFRRWNEILEEMRKACLSADYTAIAEHDIAFHRSIVRRANERDLEAIWSSMLARVRHHFWETQRTNYDSPMEIYEEHLRILEVFRRRDLEASVAALEANIA